MANIPEFAYSEGTSYRFRLDQDLRLRFPETCFGNHSFRDGFDREWLAFENTDLVIRSGYAWDGASPKIRIGTWIGTPDFHATRKASLVHDALYQFLHVDCFPLTRRESDEIFLGLMCDAGFPAARIYHGAVRVFGGMFARSDPSLFCASGCH